MEFTKSNAIKKKNILSESRAKRFFDNKKNVMLNNSDRVQTMPNIEKKDSNKHNKDSNFIIRPNTSSESLKYIKKDEIDLGRITNYKYSDDNLGNTYRNTMSNFNTIHTKTNTIFGKEKKEAFNLDKITSNPANVSKASNTSKSLKFLMVDKINKFRINDEFKKSYTINK